MQGIEKTFTGVDVLAIPKPGKSVTSKSVVDEVYLKGRLALPLSVLFNFSKLQKIN